MAGLQKKEDKTLADLKKKQADVKKQYDEIKALSDADKSPGAKGGGNKYTAQLRDLTNQLNSLNSQVDLRGQGKNADGSYIRPEYESLINQDTGLLDSQYTLADDWQNVEADREGYEAFKKEALRESGTPSSWANMMSAKTDAAKKEEIDNLAASQNATLRQTYDDLAAQGGISGGSRERIASQSLADVMRLRQEARRKATADNLNVAATDEENRLKMLGEVPGMDMQRANLAMQNQQNLMTAKQYDSNQAISQMDKERADEMDAWKTNMETWAANKQADAQARSSGGGGCFPAGTMITMNDESKRPIETIINGDIVLGGGRVDMAISFVKKDGYDLYDYHGVRVTGSHAVMEDGKWVRVKDSMDGILLDDVVTKVYNLITKNHMIIINRVMFSDYMETDEDLKDDVMSLRALNGDV